MSLLGTSTVCVVQLSKWVMWLTPNIYFNCFFWYEIKQFLGVVSAKIVQVQSNPGAMSSMYPSYHIQWVLDIST